MHRLESCKNPQKSLDNGAGLGGAVRMAPASHSSWSSPGSLSPSSGLWGGTSWASSGLGPPAQTAAWPAAAAASPLPNHSTINWGASGSSSSSSTLWLGTPGPSTSKTASADTISCATSSSATVPSAASGSATTATSPSASTAGVSTSDSRRSRHYNIHTKLRELYLEECCERKVSPPLALRNLKRSSRLLEKLVERDNLNTMIVNLYPGNKGYSLSVREHGKSPPGTGGSSKTAADPVIETMQFPYSEDHLLQSVDREELPHALADILEASHSRLFYQGCIIAEVRDYRHTYPLSTYQTHHVLLKPTTQSIINDVNMLSAQHELSAEERLSLESQIVLATAPPLCLDPNPAIGILLNNIQAKKHRWSTAPLRRSARKYSQVTVNRKRKLDQFTAHDSLHLYDFICKKRAKAAQGKVKKNVDVGAMPAPPGVPRDDPVPLAPPLTEPDVFKYAQVKRPAPQAPNDCSCSVVEEYILETERTPGVIYHIRLSVLQRRSSLEYLGELYVDKDYRKGEHNGSSCRFELGSLENAQKYIQQFREIFTEEGRKTVKITHLKPGQMEQVTFTPSMRERQQLVPMQALQRPVLTINNTQQVVGSMGVPSQAKQTALPSVSQLTHLLKSATVPPNVNVHQIQQSQGGIQSILSGALTAGVLTAEGLSNGPLSAVPQANATVHYQPVPTATVAAQVASTSTLKPTRPLNSNPQIAALAHSLRNSVEQFEAQAQAQAQAQVANSAAASSAAAVSSQNPTILGLLNAAPAARAPRGKSAAPQRLPNKAVVVNNNQQQLRVTLSSYPNQLVQQSAQVNQSGATQQGFTLVTTQAGQSQQPQTYSLSSLAQSQGFTLSSAAHAPQTFTVVPNNFLPSVHQSQTFQINPSGTTGQTFTITAPVVTVSSHFPNQTQTFTVNIPQTSQSGGQAKTFTIQANPPSLSKPTANQLNAHHALAKVNSVQVGGQQPMVKVQQRRASTTFQQSELTKLLAERGDSRAMTERHIAEKDLKLDDNRGASNLGLTMPGLSALLANTPSADNPIPGASSSSALLDRLSTPTAAQFTSPPHTFLPPSPAAVASPLHTSPSHHTFNSVHSPSPKSQVQLQASPTSNSPLSSPPGAAPVSLNLSGLSLQNISSTLQMYTVPCLSLNVGGQQGVLMTSLATPTTTAAADPTMVLSGNASALTQQQITLPVAQIMGTSNKSGNSRQQAISIPQGTGQSIQLVSALQRPSSRSSGHQMAGGKMQPIAARSAVSDRPAVKMAAGTANSTQIPAGSQMVALSPQQYQLLQKHGIQGISLGLAPQKTHLSAGNLTNKHRRRSSAADPNK